MYYIVGLRYDPDEVINALDLFKEVSKQRNYSEIEDNFSKNRIITDDSFKYLFEVKNDIHDDIMYAFPDVSAVTLAIVINDKVLPFNDDTLKQEIIKLQDLMLNSKSCKIKEIGFVCDKTNFYSTAGGQCHDTGTVTIFKEDEKFELKVHRVKKMRNVVIHFCDLEELKK